MTMAALASVTSVVRIARPCSNLAAARRFYVDALGLMVLAEFADHEGFDGLIVGEPGARWHLELVHEHGVAVARPSVEDLLVLYLPEPGDFAARKARVLSHDYRPVAAHNPYWERDGVTFEGPDGYRVVLTRRAWPASPTAGG
jgi:catechol 2,3-dioxygenase-like lactoylglutathione lyase family enzyme